MGEFYPALAHTDMVGYIDSFGNRNLMSIRGLMPDSMSQRFLTSLSFDESIHYSFSQEIGDPVCGMEIAITAPEKVFVDCGAFHYKNLQVPKFKIGGFANALTAYENYQRRHLSRDTDCDYLLCSPDHIIPPGCEDKMAEERRKFTLSSAEEFLDLLKGEERAKPVGVVHGRTAEERAEMTEQLIEIGYDYIAFGGLVPLARNPGEVLMQLIGTNLLESESPQINESSALGIANNAGVKTHLFGLNSPDWYRWIKRLGVDSFDGSKLSTEGAVNGIIWTENEFSVDNPPENARSMYRRLQIKKIRSRKVIKKGGHGKFDFSEDGVLDFDNPGWKYLNSARCTSPKCRHGPEVHNCDPRVTGSIEHNMGRTILNSWVFESLMDKMDLICEKAKSSDDDNLIENWSPIEVE